MDIRQAKEEVAYFMRRLYTKGLTTTSGGNISLRIDNQIFITPSQIDKAIIKTEEIGIISILGENQTQHLKPSMESKMHLAIYNSRPDVNAVVHAHPVFATSFCISKKEIKTNLAGETWAVVGVPVRADYRLMGTQDLANVVAEASLMGNVILLENHGVLAVGNSLLQAYDRMEVTETAAKMTFITDLLGERKELSETEVAEIDKLFTL